MFYVGQKVVCVDDSYDAELWSQIILDHYWPNRPIRGRVYTVRFVKENGIRLCEIVNPARDFLNGFIEGGFNAERFRPLVERKTDISIFKKMLVPQEEKM